MLQGKISVKNQVQSQDLYLRKKGEVVITLCVSEGRNMGDRLIKQASREELLNAQLQAHNIDCQLDRDQRKDHLDTHAAVNKLTDALLGIAKRFHEKMLKQRS